MLGDVTVSSALVAEVGNGLRKGRREGSDRKVSGPNGESEGKTRTGSDDEARRRRIDGGGTRQRKEETIRSVARKKKLALSPPLRPLERERPPRLPVSSSSSSSFSSAQFLTLMLSALPRLPSFLPAVVGDGEQTGREDIRQAFRPMVILKISIKKH